MTEEKKPAAREDFSIETDKLSGVSNEKSGFKESSVHAEISELKEEGRTAVALPKSAEDIPREPLSKRFSTEE